ncbi:MAG: hypothetical protein EA374_07715 [Acholeplasmatales bacterium]|nr:MAG: hypothetical protein EA374_07715 [Acholeplasmatales bacterium]
MVHHEKGSSLQQHHAVNHPFKTNPVHTVCLITARIQQKISRTDMSMHGSTRIMSIPLQVELKQPLKSARKRDFNYFETTLKRQGFRKPYKKLS